MAFPLIPTVLILGACWSLVCGVLAFWATHNYKAMAITAAGVFMVALVYLVLRILQEGVGA